LDLAEKLQRVLRDGSLVQSYRNRAQIRVQRYYDWDRVVDQYEKLFSEMTGEAGPISSFASDSSVELPKKAAFSRK